MNWPAAGASTFFPTALLLKSRAAYTAPFRAFQRLSLVQIPGIIQLLT